MACDPGHVILPSTMPYNLALISRIGRLHHITHQSLLYDVGLTVWLVQSAVEAGRAHRLQDSARAGSPAGQRAERACGVYPAARGPGGHPEPRAGGGRGRAARPAGSRCGDRAAAGCACPGSPCLLHCCLWKAGHMHAAWPLSSRTVRIAWQCITAMASLQSRFAERIWLEGMPSCCWQGR